MFETFNRVATDYLCWERVPDVDYSVEEKVFRFLRSECFTDYFETIASCGSFLINSYVIAYGDVGETPNHFKNFYKISTQSTLL